MSANQVRKAVIPAAGFGTRLFPATKGIKKELFPIIDQDGRTKPVILAIVEEAISAGIEEIAIVTQKGDRSFQDFFQTPPTPELFAKLSGENQQYSQYLQELGERITILIQEEQEGYGHAVFCAQDWVAGEPFLLLLGDHVYTSERKISCAAQIVEVYQQVNTSVIGLTIMPAEIIHKAGCVVGEWREQESILKIKQIYEKPTLEYARKSLHTPGLPEDQFLAVFGMYLLEASIFEYLAADIKNDNRYRGEFQLTTCLEKLRLSEGALGYLVEGQYFDTGMPQFYRQTIIDFGKDLS